MAIRTVEDLESALTSDLLWRTREMFHWEKLADRTSGEARAALLRGGLALLYAHWEGYVKTAGSNYLQFISRQGLRVGDLRPEIAAVAMRSRIERLATEKRAERHTEMIDDLRNEGDIDANLPYTSATIRTRANLNFETFASIMHSLGCSSAEHAASSVHIDRRILGARNEIAHGRQEYVSLEDWVAARDVVERILRDVRVQLSNAAATHAYRRVYE